MGLVLKEWSVIQYCRSQNPMMLKRTPPVFAKIKLPTQPNCLQEDFEVSHFEVQELMQPMLRHLLWGINYKKQCLHIRILRPIYTAF